MLTDSRGVVPPLARLLRQDTSGESGGYCCLLELAQDPIANYVVSKAIEVSDGDQEDRILELLSASRQELVRRRRCMTWQCLTRCSVTCFPFVAHGAACAAFARVPTTFVAQSESVYAQYVMKNAQCAEKRCDGSATTDTSCTLTTTMSD